jgi:hypothetical protein
MALLGEQVRGWRARGSLERGRLRPRGRSALERGETSPKGATGPRARLSFVSAVLQPSSEAEFRPRVPGPIVLVGRWGYRGRDYVVRVLGLRICLCLHFLRKKMGFPRFFRGPLWLSLTPFFPRVVNPRYRICEQCMMQELI